MGKKGTKAGRIQRIKEIKELMLVGKTRCAILEYAKKWAVSVQMIDADSAIAREQIREINSIDFKDSRSLVLNNYWEVYHAAKAARNIKEQRSVLDSIARVCGLERLVIEMQDEYPDLKEGEVMEELERRLSEASSQMH